MKERLSARGASRNRKAAASIIDHHHALESTGGRRKLIGACGLLRDELGATRDL